MSNDVLMKHIAPGLGCLVAWGLFSSPVQAVLQVRKQKALGVRVPVSVDTITRSSPAIPEQDSPGHQEALPAGLHALKGAPVPCTVTAAASLHLHLQHNLIHTNKTAPRKAGCQHRTGGLPAHQFTSPLGPDASSG